MPVFEVANNINSSGLPDKTSIVVTCSRNVRISGNYVEYTHRAIYTETRIPIYCTEQVVTTDENKLQTICGISS